MINYYGNLDNEYVKVQVDDGELGVIFLEIDENDIETVSIVKKQLKLNEIKQLKQKLADTDYIACKIAEGESTREDYAFELEERREWRRRINELEEKIK